MREEVKELEKGIQLEDGLHNLLKLKSKSKIKKRIQP